MRYLSRRRNVIIHFDMEFKSHALSLRNRIVWQSGLANVISILKWFRRKFDPRLGSENGLKQYSQHFPANQQERTDSSSYLASNRTR